METFEPHLKDLFLQLGLPNDDASINSFIKQHRMSATPKGTTPPSAPASIVEAPWWTPAQADFLRQAIKEDAEWAIAVDSLNVLLQKDQ